MNKEIIILGIIIVIIGIGLMVYSEKNILSSEYKPGLDRRWVSLEEVDSMKAQGWEILGSGYTQNGDVFMVREGTYLEEYYVVESPYQIVGAIVALIGSVTSIIGIAIKEANNPTRSND